MAAFVAIEQKSGVEKLGNVIARTYKRKAHFINGHTFTDQHIGPLMIRWVDTNTTGRFMIQLNSITFEDGQDATMFTLKFGR